MTTSSLLTPLLALAAPLVLWPVELYLPYPYIIEELVKGGLVWLSPKFKSALIIGLAFAFSETVLYIFNFNPARLIYTTSLHVITTLIIYLPTHWNRKLIIIGVVVASTIHYIYNALLTPGV